MLICNKCYWCVSMLNHDRPSYCQDEECPISNPSLLSLQLKIKERQNQLDKASDKEQRGALHKQINCLKLNIKDLI
jgi:hypothetical protein